MSVKPQSIKKIINEGYFTNLSNSDYHNSNGVSSTTLDDIEKSVALFLNRDQFKYQNPAFDIGNLIHDALAFPDNFEDSYIECSTASSDTKAAQKQRDDNPDKIIVPKGMIEASKEISYKVNLIFGDYIKVARKESSFIFFDEESNLTLKIRPDLHLTQHGIILDYKTTREDKPLGFLKNLEQYNYHRSAAFYIDGVNKAIEKFNLPFQKVTQFGWICIPKNAPYKPYGLIASDDLIQKGRTAYQEVLNKVNSFNETGKDELFKVAYSWENRKDYK